MKRIGIMLSKKSKEVRKGENSLNINQRQTSVLRPELCGQPRHNAIIPSKQNSELSNDSNDNTIAVHYS